GPAGGTPGHWRPAQPAVIAPVTAGALGAVGYPGGAGGDAALSAGRGRPAADPPLAGGSRHSLGPGRRTPGSEPAGHAAGERFQYLVAGPGAAAAGLCGGGGGGHFGRCLALWRYRGRRGPFGGSLVRISRPAAP